MQKRSQQNTPEDPHATTRPDTEGTHVWWLVNEEMVGSRRGVLVVTEIPPGRRHVLHRHPNCEQATYVLSGAGLHLTVGEAVRQADGDAVYVKPGEWHGFENDSEEEVTLVMLYGGVGSREEAGYELYEADGSREDPEKVGRVKKVTSDEAAGDEGVSWLVTAGTVGARDVALGVFKLGPEAAQGLHRHPNADEVLLVAGGGGTHLGKGGGVALGEREVAYVPAGEWHGLRSAPTAPTTAILGYLGVAEPVKAGYEEGEAP